jgi:hypothetical protein
MYGPHISVILSATFKYPRKTSAIPAALFASQINDIGMRTAACGRKFVALVGINKERIQNKELAEDIPDDEENSGSSTAGYLGQCENALVDHAPLGEALDRVRK